MFLRALMTREFWATTVIVGACCCFWIYQLYKTQTKIGLIESPVVQVSLLQDQLREPPNEEDFIVALADYEFLGEPFVKNDNTFQLLGPTGGDKDAPLDPALLVIARSHILDGEGLRKMICNSRGGTWYSRTNPDQEPVDSEEEPDSKQETDSEQDTFSHPEYPNLDLSEISHVGYLSLAGLSGLVYMFWAIVAVHALAILGTLWLMVRGLAKRDAWTTKLENYDPKVLEQYPHAQRLCGMASLALSPRTVDQTFDVAHKPAVKNPKIKRWGWKLGTAIGITAIGAVLQFGTSYGVEQWLNTQWARALVIFAFFAAVHIAIAMAQRVKVGGIQEEPVEPGTRWAGYQKLPFFKYHDRVLKSLGMVELGAFRQSGCQNPMVRTIYLSPLGNVLVEVGAEAGREFFTVETVVNSGKFLETHSLAKPRYVKSDLLLRHQRRSASHEDILKALEEHDVFVGEFAGSGFYEAQFDEQKFPRFLEWGGAPKAA